MKRNDRSLDSDRRRAPARRPSEHRSPRCRTRNAAAAAAQRRDRHAGDAGADRGRAFDGARHRHADHARLADERRHRRRHGDVAPVSCCCTARRPARSRCSCGSVPAAYGGMTSPSDATSAGWPIRSSSCSRARTSRSASNGRDVVLSGTRADQRGRARKSSAWPARSSRRRKRSSTCCRCSRAPTNQVLLKVRFAEVSRSALTELGISLFTSPTGINNTLGRVTTQQFSAPGFDELNATKTGDDPFKFGAPVADRERQVHVQRLPEPVHPQREVRPRRAHQGAVRRAVCSRVWPSRTWLPRAARKPASSPAASSRFRSPSPAAATASRSSSRSSASA